MRISRLLILLIWMLFSQEMKAQDCGYYYNYDRGRCTQGNCRKGFGIKKFDNGDRYEGEWRGGQMHGQGTYYHANGDTYIGEYKEGKRHGHGTYKWTEGDVYIGEYVNNIKEGCGQLTFTSCKGEVIVKEGYFSNNKFVGEPPVGPIVERAKEEIKVKPVLPAPQSLNNYSGKTGDCITGDCKNGYGVFVFCNSDRYEGDFKNGMKHRQGTYTTKGGNTYQGMYKDDRRHGYGTYRWANGAIFIGEYKFGKRNGWGQFIDEHGNKQEGEYVNNRFLGDCDENQNAQNAQAAIPTPEKKASKSSQPIGWLNPAQNGQSVNGCCFIVEACIASQGKPIKVKIFNNDEVVATLTAKEFKEESGDCQHIIRHPILLNVGKNNLYFTVEDEKKAVFFSQPIVIHKGSE